jgi:hypothetical protein
VEVTVDEGALGWTGSVEGLVPLGQDAAAGAGLLGMLRQLIEHGGAGRGPSG